MGPFLKRGVDVGGVVDIGDEFNCGACKVGGGAEFLRLGECGLSTT